MGFNTLHVTFAAEFFAACGREVESQGFFPSTASEFATSAALRSSEYCRVFIIESDHATAIRLVAEKFLENVGDNPQDLAQSVVIIGKFAADATGTKDMFDKLKRTIRLTDQ